MRILTAAAVLALAGCSTVQKMDRNMMTRFQMIDATTWSMSADTAALYPVESERAEAIRLGWISEHTRANGCTDFEITGRQWTRAVGKSVSESMGTLNYTGTCRR